MINNRRIWAIIPASGVGHRMQSDRPKQYLSFCDKTVLEHTLDRLLGCDQVHGVILVLREDDEYWPKLQYHADKPLHIAHGGAERQDSVINGLILLHQVDKEECYAMVHDAARPLVQYEELSALINAVKQNKSGAILASPVADTLKRGDSSGHISETVDRNNLWRAFTPQLFESALLLDALQQAKNNQQVMTDDAAAMAAVGHAVQLVEGRSDNIKITRPEDLRLAEQIWKNQQQSNKGDQQHHK